MPGKPSRICSYPGCRTLSKESRCDKHQRPAWERSAPAPERIRGRKLQEMRAALFCRQPTCEECERNNRVTLATIRDHRIPLAEGGRDDESNEQALCERCHDAKSAEEAKRGVGRVRGGV